MKDKAEKEYETTPLGIKELEDKLAICLSYDSSQMSQDMLEESIKSARKNLLTAKQRRAEQLKKYKLAGKKEVIEHRSDVDIDRSYARLGLRTEFDSTSTDRIGWSEGSEQFNKNAAFLMRASDRWINKLNDEQISAVKWFTGSGSEMISIEAAIKGEKDEDKSLSSQRMQQILDRIGGIKNYERKKKSFNEALMLAPSSKKPVILYRGIGRNYKISLDEIAETGIYETPTAVSSTLNPGIANRFGSGRVVLEMKTRHFGSPTNFSGQYASEEEVIIPQGTKFRVVKVMKGMTFGWSPDHPVNGYTVVQLEEIE